MNLSDEEKKILLATARKSINSLFNDIELPEPDLQKHPVFNLETGVFVTLTIDGNLRGCIGYIEGYRPLYSLVADAAIQAAKNDPRFMPLNENEKDRISIEISVLSPAFSMEKYEDIEIGKHGLILEEGGHRGLLLPQVPVEHNMDLEEYLSSLCQKAGLPYNFWKERVLNIEMFTAAVFSEKELGRQT